MEEVQQRLEQAGQPHLLRFWPEFSEEQQQRFLQELSQLDLGGLRRHCEEAVKAATAPSESLHRLIEPVPSEFIGSVRRSDQRSLEEWESRGKEIGRAFTVTAAMESPRFFFLVSMLFYD